MPIAWVVGYLCGALLALAPRRALYRSQDPVRTRYGAIAAAFALLIAGPSALAMYVLEPDWFLVYLANSAHLPRPMMVPFVFLTCAGLPLIGFMVTHWAVFTERTRAIQASILVPIVLIMFLGAISRARLSVVALYDAYFSDGIRLAIGETSLAWLLAAIAFAHLGVMLGGILLVRRHVATVARAVGATESSDVLQSEANPKPAA